MGPGPSKHRPAGHRHGVLRVQGAQASLPGQGSSLGDVSGVKEEGNVPSLRSLPLVPVLCAPTPCSIPKLGHGRSPCPALPGCPGSFPTALPKGERFRNAGKLTAWLVLRTTTCSEGLTF